MSRLTYKHWTVFSLLTLAAAVIAILAFANGSRYLILLVVPPLVASMTTTPRRAAIVAALTVGSTAAIGVTNLTTSTGGFAIRAAVIVIVSAISIQVSILRERDLRTRRRISLMNTARAELEGSSGFEDELASLGRAAVVDFADWVILDIRVDGDSSERRVFSNESLTSHHTLKPQSRANATTTSYEQRGFRDGPFALSGDDSTELMTALFDSVPAPLRTGSVIVVPARADDVSVVYFFVCPHPHPPWGQAETTQIESLSRSAILAARSYRLIDELSYARSELRSSRDQIQAIVNAIDDGVTAQSISGEMLFANDRAAEMFGVGSAEELIGMHFGDVHRLMDLRDELGRPFDPMDLPSKRSFAGERTPEAIVRYTIKETGKEWWTHVRARAILGRDGTPIMAISVIEDVTAQRRDQLASEMLAQASHNLHQSLDESSAVQAITSAVLPAFGDWCAVDLVENGSDVELARWAAADPNQNGNLEALLLSRDEHSASYELLVGDEPGKLLLGDDVIHRVFGAPALDTDNDEALVKSAVVAEISARGQKIGAITVARANSPLSHTEHDLHTLLELGRRAGIAIDNSRVHSDRTEMLRVLQRSLIPPDLPQISGIELTAMYLAAETDSRIGGDFYDVIRMEDGSSSIVVGDICGKGTRAAALTAMARHTLRTAAKRERNVVDVVRTLNTALRDLDEPDQFSTLCAVQFGPRADRSQALSIVNCGHPLPILLTSSGAQAIGESGTLLGIVEDPELSTSSYELKLGEHLVVYTDGLSGGETTDDTGFAVETITTLLESGGEIDAGRICDAAISRHSHRRRDDIAVVTAALTQS